MTRARKPRVDARGLPIMTEDAIQIALVAQIDRACAPGVVALHIANGGKRAKATAARLKAMGVRKGAADMLYLLAGSRIVFHELKAEDGEWRGSQKEFCAAVRALGCEYYVTKGLDAALELARHVGVLKTREAA
jgi:hypothetical protein